MLDWNLGKTNSYDSKEQKRVTERWESRIGLENRDYIIQKIMDNDVNRLLDSDVQSGRLKGFLDDERDIKGFYFQNNNFKFKEPTDFAYLDFSYSNIYNTTFENFTFLSNTFDFCNFYNCQFINCKFLYTYFFCATFDKSKFENCDFIDKNRLRNCILNDTIFNNLNCNNSLFINCKFNTLT
jgi:uncharacterized protein YjbI with pentapeptide repeats